jgi:Protein of unknown function (DUF2550)
VGEALDDIIWLLVAVLLLLALAAAVIAVRRFLLERGGGTIECGLRAPADTGGWRPGVASYHRDELYWYRALGILLRPRRMFTRRSLGVISRRPAEPAEARVLGPGRVVVQLDTDSADQVELAMTPEALTGFLAWLEASPPSSHLGDIALTPGYLTYSHLCHGSVFASAPVRRIAAIIGWLATSTSDETPVKPRVRAARYAAYIS